LRLSNERTFHGFDVMVMWREEPQEVMKFKGMLPFATLGQTDSGERLLSAVAAKIKAIKSKEERRELFRMSQAFAGLRYDKNLVYRILKEGSMLEESVVVQDWIQHGVQKGLQQGKREGLQQGERRIFIRQLERLLGKLPIKTRKQVEALSSEQLETLSEDLLSFQAKTDLTAWLKQPSPPR
jgi:predicted transposase YdaD